MKLITCRYNGAEHTAVVTHGDTQAVMTEDLGYHFRDMNDLIRKNFKVKKVTSSAKDGETVIISDAELDIPWAIPHPVRDVICMGLNYKAHADEMAEALNEEKKERVYPIYFGKAVDRCLGHGEAVPSHSDFISTLDYECELAVILGKDAYQVPAEEVSDYIFGYSILNDVTGRELSRHKQNYFMKSLDGSCPMGPWIVTADEIPYPPELQIRLSVNGEPRQNGNTGDMIFGISEIVSELSRGVTLQAGTIFATGSPTGIGFGMKPPVFLKDGDVMRCTIEKIGVLTNTVKD